MRSGRGFGPATVALHCDSFCKGSCTRWMGGDELRSVSTLGEEPTQLYGARDNQLDGARCGGW
jgi:hypothetical protein